MFVPNVRINTLLYLVFVFNYRIAQKSILLADYVHNVKMDITLIGIFKIVKKPTLAGNLIIIILIPSVRNASSVIVLLVLQQTHVKRVKLDILSHNQQLLVKHLHAHSIKLVLLIVLVVVTTKLHVLLINVLQIHSIMLQIKSVIHVLEINRQSHQVKINVLNVLMQQLVLNAPQQTQSNSIILIMEIVLNAQLL